MSSETRHLTPDAIAAWRARTLAAAELLAVDDHLAVCAACRALAADAARVGRSVLDLRLQLAADADAADVADHPSLEAIAAFVEGGLDDVERELVEAHLEVCPACAEDAARGSGLVLRHLAPNRPETREDPQNRQIRETPVDNVAKQDLTPRYVLAALAAGFVALLLWIGQSAAPGPEPVALDDAGTRVTLDADGTLRGLPALTDDEAQAVRTALADHRLDVPPFISALGGASGTLMGPTDPLPELRPVRPLATAVEDVRPRFEWTPLAGAGVYVVSVFDADFNQVQESPGLTSTRWQPRDPLARGRTYVWQVRAQGPGLDVTAPAPPAAEARFHVLAGDVASRLADVRRRLGGSHLALGVLLARAGALDAARQELEALAAANPDADAPRQLLEALRLRR